VQKVAQPSQTIASVQAKLPESSRNSPPSLDILAPVSVSYCTISGIHWAPVEPLALETMMFDKILALVALVAMAFALIYTAVAH
jgi:hypothetical protein